MSRSRAGPDHLAVLDTSLSMTFGTGERRKADVAEESPTRSATRPRATAIRLGVVTFGDPSPRTLPPRQGRPGLLGLLHAVRPDPAEEPIGATSFREALARVARVARRRSLVVLVSDFRGPLDWRRELLHVASRCHVLGVEVLDRREQELPDVGDLWLVDAETGRLVRADTSSGACASDSPSGRLPSGTSLRAFSSAGADHLVLTTSGDWLRELASFLRRPGPRGAA